MPLLTRILPLAVALAACGPGFAQEDVFPFAFPSEAAASEACASLLSPEGIARAARGALVFMTVPGRSSSLVASTAVADMAGRLEPVPPQSRRVMPPKADGAGNLSASAFDARSPASGVRCWFRFTSGAMRLTTIEIMLEP